LDGPLAGLMETTMSINDTSYGVAATSERELTIDKLDAAIDTFFHALLRPAVLSQGDGQRGLTGAGGCAGHHEMSVSGAAGEPVHSSGEKTVVPVGATSDWMVSAGSTRRSLCDETSCSSKLYYRYADCADILTGSFRSGRDAACCRGNDAACCRGNDQGLEDARVRCVQLRWDTAGTLIG
jgi:hypothetical protein